MQGHSRTLIVGIVLIALICTAVLILRPQTAIAPIDEQASSATSSALIAVLDTDGTSNGQPEGCDKVQFVNVVIAPTTTPLFSALSTLFSFNTDTVGGWFNFIDRTDATLSLQSASIVGSVAHIYLTGTLSGLSGVCDNPRADIQIRQTALQIPGVSSVQLYLNNSPVTTLAPSMQ